MTRVISFSSGKGGVGKTSLVSNLGYLWAKSGKRTLLVDGDWSLGKLAIALGAKPKWTVEKVLSGQIALSEAIEPVRDKLHLLASPTGVVGFEEMDEASRNQLYFEMEGLSDQYDLILMDHSSGVNWGVIQFAAAAHQHVIVTTTEPTSYTDAYAIMKILSKRFGIREFLLIVTMSSKTPGTMRIIDRFSDLTRSQLNVRLTLLDVFPWDPRLPESIRKRKPYVELHPQAELTDQFQGLCRRIEDKSFAAHHGLNFFYKSQPNFFTMG